MAPASPSVADIIKARNHAVVEVDAQIITTTNLQTPGDNSLDQPLKDLTAQKVAIMEKAVTDILASADLAAALKAMKDATDDMDAVSKKMTTVTGILNNITSFLGYGTAVVNAINSVAKPAAPAGKS